MFVAERVGHGGQGRAGDQQRLPFGVVDDLVADGAEVLRVGELPAGGGQLAHGFGGQVPPGPGRPLRGDGVQHGVGQRGDLARVDVAGVAQPCPGGWARRLPRPRCGIGPEDLRGAGSPLLEGVGQARVVLRGAGGQGDLLPQPAHPGPGQLGARAWSPAGGRRPRWRGSVGRTRRSGSPGRRRVRGRGGGCGRGRGSPTRRCSRRVISSARTAL